MCGSTSLDLDRVCGCIECNTCELLIDKEHWNSILRKPQLSELEEKWLQHLNTALGGNLNIDTLTPFAIAELLDSYARELRKQPVWKVGDFLIEGDTLWRVTEVSPSSNYDLEAIKGNCDYKYFKSEGFQPITQEQILKLAALKSGGNGMSKHSKLPWEVCEHSWSDTSIYSSDQVVCTKSIESDCEDEDDQEKLEPLMDANMEFIVKACNSHYDMLKALKEADEYLSINHMTNIGHGSKLHRMFQEAIAKAEGE